MEKVGTRSSRCQPKHIHPGALHLRQLYNPGQYTLLLDTEKNGKMTTAVRIPIHVGGGGGHGSHGSGFGATEIALLVAAAGAAGFFDAPSRQCKTILANSETSSAFFKERKAYSEMTCPGCTITKAAGWGHYGHTSSVAGEVVAIRKSTYAHWFVM